MYTLKCIKKCFPFELKINTLDLSVLICSFQDVQKSSDVSRKVFNASLLFTYKTISSAYSNE